MNKKGKNAKDKFKGKIFKRMKEVNLMIKKIAWETFKNTGDINTFLEFKQIEEIEKELVEQPTKLFQKEIEENKQEKW